jgi:hypothetical protein
LVVVLAFEKAVEVGHLVEVEVSDIAKGGHGNTPSTRRPAVCFGGLEE